jgi:hypothetical protein
LKKKNTHLHDAIKSNEERYSDNVKILKKILDKVDNLYLKFNDKFKIYSKIIEFVAAERKKIYSNSSIDIFENALELDFIDKYIILNDLH